MTRAKPAEPRNEACPCGVGLTYRACCEPFHLGPKAGLAPTPEALMRSRYSAFVKDLRPYLLDTWHASHKPAFIEPPEPGLRWLGLSVLGHGMSGPGEGWVQFVARSKLGGRAHRLQETSRFVRENGRWWYVDAWPPGTRPL